MKIVHATTVHGRHDIRIFKKECSALAENFGNLTLAVGDGKGSVGLDDSSCIHFFDIGAAPKSRLVRMLRQPLRIYHYVRSEMPDVFHFHDPELLPVGLMLKRLGIAVVYDAHEDVPRQILGKHWIPSIMRTLVSSIFEYLENFVAHRISGVVAATPHIASRFKKINPNTTNVNNFPLPDELAPLDGEHERKSWICYVGGITRIRGLEPLIHALPLVPDVRLILCGQFSEAGLESELRGLPGWQQVDYRGQVDRMGLQVIMSECIAGIVTFLPLPNHIDAQPNKMFEYMSAELPVIASDFPLWRQIIDGADAGICVEPTSPEAIAAAIRRLLEDPVLVESMGRAGREAVLTRYNWPAEAEKLRVFYKELK
jgi:glycosyltransferase involved in cell wall biosynthesis